MHEGSGRRFGCLREVDGSLLRSSPIRREILPGQAGRRARSCGVRFHFLRPAGTDGTFTDGGHPTSFVASETPGISGTFSDNNRRAGIAPNS